MSIETININVPLPEIQPQQKLQQIRQVVEVEQNQNQFNKVMLQKTQKIQTIQANIDYRYPQFVQYFSSKQIKKNVLERTTSLLIDRQQKLNSQISHGKLQISDNIRSVSELSNPVRENNKPDKIDIILTKKSRLQMQLKAIQQQLKDIQPPKEQQKTETTLELSPIQHKKFVERMIKVRRFSDNKRKMMLEYEQNKKMEALKKQEQLRKQSEQKRKRQRQKLYKDHLDQLQKKKEKLQIEQIQSAKRYKSVLQQKRRHQLMKQQYQNTVLCPILQEQKKILEERRSRFKGYSIQQIQNFEREYNKSHQQLSSRQKSESKQQWHYKPPSFSPRLIKLLQQQKMQQKIQLETKKRAIQQNIQRRSSYAQYIKESIPVKIDEKKKLQLQRLNTKPASNKKSKEQIYSLGNKYLLEGKKKAQSQIKKQSYSTREGSKSMREKQQNKKLNTSMSHYENNKYISQAHQNRITKILASKSIEKSHKMEKLKIQVDILSERAKRKQQMEKVIRKNKEDEHEISQLLSSIKAKVGMMELLKS